MYKRQYLILDGKITLIDTCKKPFTGELIERIGTIVDPASIDYIAVSYTHLDVYKRQLWPHAPLRPRPL